MPRGGARPGAGRKPKTAAVAALHGSHQRTVVRFPAAPAAPSAPLVPVAVAIPGGLPAKARRAWERLAPFAVEAGTLTAGTAAAFAMLCRAVVLEAALGKGGEAGGPSHRGMMQRVEAGMVRFSLAPVGKPIAKAAKPEDPFAEFEAGATG